MKFLITGADMGNKGAQSMLFITISELRDRFPDCEIYYGAWDNNDVSNIKIVRLSISIISLNKIFNRIGFLKLAFRIIKDFLKMVLGKSNDFLHYNDLKRTMPKINAIVDVSGFSMGKKWSLATQERWLDYIRLAKKYDIPIYFMPQSFGPFGYSEEKKYSHLYCHMKELMPYASVIFAREAEGATLLKEEFGLENVVRSDDLVLQNKGSVLENIFKTIPQIIIPKLPNRKCVGIVPNQQCFRYGNSNKLIELYREIVEKLISDGYYVVIFHHSQDDQEICIMLKKMFSNENVYLEKKDFSCIEYDEYVRKFDFIICSRFHGCVHAYRNSIPCILLGWAVKYYELATNVGQEQYAFDIAAENFITSTIIAAVDHMIEHRDEETQTIKLHVDEIQKHNCFDQIEE